MSTKRANDTTLGLISVLWPSSLTAIAATVIFFAFFDPADFTNCTIEDNNCHLGVYSIGFLAFWLLTALTSILTCYFRRPYEKS